MPIVKKVVQGVASGIGLASEAVTARKQSPAPVSSSERAQGPSSRDLSLPPAYREVDEKDDNLSEGDEQDWDLDDAATDIVDSRAESGNKEAPKDVGEILRSFIARNPTSTHAEQGQLPCPVILPQRRPQDKSRGFIRAYAPVLGDCGIDQVTFMDFLETFDKAGKASPAIQVVNLAAMIVGFVPSAAAQITSAVVTVACGVAKGVQERTRTHSFLREMNEKFFQPRGLYCLVMTYKPEQRETHELVDINKAIAKALNPSESRARRQLDKLKVSSGKAYGELELPEAAPLVFPALDNASDGQKKSAFKKSSNFVGDYLDRRAQATYNAKNPNSSLSVAPEPKFTSRYADPNHPASNGNLISLVTGGHINPEVMRDDRRGRGLGGGLGSGLGGRRERGLGGGLGGGLLGAVLGGGLGGRGMDDRGYGGRGIEDQGYGRRVMDSRDHGRGLRGRRFDEGDYDEREYEGAEYDERGHNGRGYERKEFEGRAPEGRGLEGRTYSSRMDRRRSRINGRQNSGPVGIKRLLAQDVLYLMIVNMPSQQEMDAALSLINNGA